jgi:hypothetical protein
MWWHLYSMHRTFNVTSDATFIDYDYNKQQPYSVLLVLTECLQMYMKYHVNSQQYILLQSAISKQQTYPTHTHTHLTHFTTTNNNCTTFICTEQHWKVILTVTYCLQSADSQHSHYYCWPINTLTAVHYTNSTTFVSPSAELKLFVLLLHWTLRYMQNILLLLSNVTEYLSHSCFNALKKNSSKHCAVGCCYCCCFPLRIFH